MPVPSTNTFCEEDAVFVPSFSPSLSIQTDEVNHRIVEWAAATHSALAASKSLFPPSSPSSSYQAWPTSSISSFSSPSSTEYHGGLPDSLELSTPSGSPPISDVLAYRLEDISVFEQKWDSSFNLSKYPPGKDSIKEVFAITTRAQEALLLQTAFLEVHLGQNVLKMQSMMEDLIRRRTLLENTFDVNNSLEAWVSMHSPEVDMFRIEGEYVSNHVVLAECKALILQADEFIIRHIPARGIGAKFLRNPATILESEKQ